jgi:hypothetical protein
VKKLSPEVETTYPANILKVVVLPAPFTPSRPNTSPFETPKDRLSTATLNFF